MNVLLLRNFPLTLVAVVMLSAGCSINHPVAKDYPAYIQNDKYPRTLPQSNLESNYIIDEETKNHRYQFRAGSVGYAHVWIVEFGKILDHTLNAEYVQEAFGRLDKSSTDTEGNLLTFSLESYEFKNHQAYVTMNVSFKNESGEAFNKTYSAMGANQAGKMWSGGPFAMKNATLQSTKFAIDDILRDLIKDLNKN